MIRGQKPLPTSLKRARGNPGKRKLNANEPVAPAGPMAMPEIVGACPIAAKYFREILANAPKNMLAPLDIGMIGRLAIIMAEGDAAITAIRAEGFTTKSSTGTMLQI